MDSDAPFKSPRPPAPRRSRSRSRLAATTTTTTTTANPYGHDQAALTTRSLLERLEGLLVAKSNEIQLAGRLGEALLNQQADLEARIRDLQDEVHHQQATNGRANEVFGNGGRDSDDESVVGIEVRQRLQALEAELERWKEGNDELFKGVASDRQNLDSSTSVSAARNNGAAPPPLPSTTSYKASLDGLGISGQVAPNIPMSATEGENGTTSPSMSRRQRNAQHRAMDVEFAAEIGQGLLVEVRRLQALLSERDATIAAGKAERDGMERSMEQLATSLKTVEENLDKFREENWNLEMSQQEMQTRISDMSASLLKTENERARLAKELAASREILDTHKVDNERLQGQLTDFKSKHETDMASMRRTNAGLQREKTDLQAAVETATKELNLRARGVRRSVSAASGVNIPGAIDEYGNPLGEMQESDEEDVFAGPRAIQGRLNDDLFDADGNMLSDAGTPDGSPALQRRGLANIRDQTEVEKLRTTLANSHKTIQTLRSALLREKEARLATKRKAVGEAATSDDEIHDDAEDDDDSLPEQFENDENDTQIRRQGLSRRSRGGRGARALVPVRRLQAPVGRMPRGPQPSRLSSEVEVNVSQYQDDIQPSSDGESIHNVSIIDHGAPEASMALSEMEELASFEDHASAQGDRDMLRSSVASYNSISAMDPAFSQILPRSHSTASTARQTSLGSLMKDPRPTSAMFATDFNLADALAEHTSRTATKKAIDLAVQTDAIVQDPPVIPDPVVIYRDVEVHAAKPSMQEISLQTDDIPPEIIEPVVIYQEVRVEVPAPRPKVVDLGVQTDKVEPERLPAPEPVVIYKEVQVPAPKAATQDVGLETDAIVPKVVPIPEPVIIYRDVEVLVQPPQPERRSANTQTDEVVVPRAPSPPPPTIVYRDIVVEAPKPSQQDSVVQTDEIVIPPPPTPEPVIIYRDVEVLVHPPKPDTKDSQFQTDELVMPSPPPPTIIYRDVIVHAVKPPTSEFSIQTDPLVLPAAPAPEPVVIYRDVIPPKPIVQDSTTMTDAIIATSSADASHKNALEPDRPDMHHDADVGADDETTIFHSGLVSDSQDGTHTPQLGSTPKSKSRALPSFDTFNLLHEQPIPRSESAAQSFKSFSVHNTGYDTATETEGDFEDAQEMLTPMENGTQLGHFSNTSRETMRTARGLDSDDDSDHYRALATPRYTAIRNRSSRQVVAEPVTLPKAMKEIGTSSVREIVELSKHEPLLPEKPSVSDVGIQTDPLVDLPRTMVTSPTMQFGQGSTATPIASAVPGGLVYLHKVGTQPAEMPVSSGLSRSVSAKSSISNVSAVTADTHATASTRKVRAPKLSIPPPPSMPPPSDIIKQHTTPSFKPPRPSSPPPPELLARAQQTPSFLSTARNGRRTSSAGASDTMSSTSTPIHGNMLGSRDEHFYGASPAPLPAARTSGVPRAVASAAQLRDAPPLRTQGASTGSEGMTSHSIEPMRRAGAITPVNTAARPPSRGASTSTRRRHDRMHPARASMSSLGSSASSISGIQATNFGEATNHSGDSGGLSGLAGTPDPIIQSITQTMIGAYFFKYTRTTFRRETSQNRHKRFFWVHPYTKTLYWSDKDHGAPDVNQSSAKSLFIAGVREEVDTNTQPPGLVGVSIVVYNEGREVKFTAPTYERHDTWMNAISYLLNRPEGTGIVPATPARSTRVMPDTPGSTRSFSLIKSINRSASSLRFRKQSDPLTLSDATREATLVPNRAGHARPGGTVGRTGKNRASVMSMMDADVDEHGQRHRSQIARPATSLGTYTYSTPSNVNAHNGTPASGSARDVEDESSRVTPKPSDHKTASKSARKMSIVGMMGGGHRETSTGHDISGPAPKRPATPAAEYQELAAQYGSPRSIRSYKRPSTAMSLTAPAPNVIADESIEFIDRRDVLGVDEHGQGYEGLENVRACCNGAHDVGSLSVGQSKRHHHHHPPASASGTASAASIASRTSSRRSNPTGTISSIASANRMFGYNPHKEASVGGTTTTTSKRQRERTSSSGVHAPGDAVPPLPAGALHLAGTFEEPGSPSLRARGLTSTLRSASSNANLAGGHSRSRKGAR